MGQRKQLIYKEINDFFVTALKSALPSTLNSCRVWKAGKKRSKSGQN
jgi:hypothetical protein